MSQDYRSGKLLTGEMKQICIETVQKVVSDFQKVCAMLLTRL